MFAVSEIALKIARKFKAKGFNINLKDIEHAALLHDAMRVCDFRDFNPHAFGQKISTKTLKIWEELRKNYQKIGHAKAMAKHLIEIGEHKLANLVEKHDFFEIDRLKDLEEKIIYYADKRVDNDKTVDLKTRIKEGDKRNKTKDEDSQQKKTTIKKLFLLEKELVKELEEKLKDLLD